MIKSSELRLYLMYLYLEQDGILRYQIFIIIYSLTMDYRNTDAYNFSTEKMYVGM